MQLALSIEFHLFTILILFLLMGCKVNLSIPFYTELQIIFRMCSRSYSGLCFFVLIHIRTSTGKLYILAKNSQIKGVYDQRWLGKTKSHIIQLGLGQSLTLKSISTPHPTFYSPPPKKRGVIENGGEGQKYMYIYIYIYHVLGARLRIL